MVKLINPLAFNVPIVDPKTGYPTEYFKRILEDIADAKISAGLIEALGGDPDEDQVVTWDDTEDDLAFKPASGVLDMIDNTHGAILYRDADEWLALAPGAAGEVLTTHGAGADPTWESAASGGALGGCRARLSGDFTGNFVPDTRINFDSEEFDDSSYHLTSSTVTITIASPGVVTWTGHTFTAGSPIVLTTTGALPTGLTAGTTYYVVNPAANTFQLAAITGGTAINTSGTQSGVHTATNGSRLNISSDGIYLVVGNVTTTSTLTAGEFSRALIRKNGSAIATQYLEDITNAVSVAASLSYIGQFANGDYVELAYDTEGDTSVTLNANGTHLGIYRLA
jgi:hypothetical protein